jgi:hypothetical protein
MLDHLSPRQFEEYCQTLFMLHYKCPVDLTPQTRDGGRDLLIHHPSGLRIVECKHYLNSTVDREVVQKLHSAVRTSGSRVGLIVTTGRFSKGAEVYAAGLQDVRMELIDAAKLAHLIAITLPNGMVPQELAAAVRTTADAEFPQVFAKSVFSEARYSRGTAPPTTVHVERVTRYSPFYVARYHAEGTLKTAVGTFDHEWEGRVWLRGDGREAGFDYPHFVSAGAGAPAPLAGVLQAVPGETRAPKLHPHDAVAQMKHFLVENCVKSISYHGRNNVRYTRRVGPSPNRVRVHALLLCYFPYQTFALRIGGVCHEGQVSEERRPPRFHVRCISLSQCTVCGAGTTAANQILCAVCFRPAHRWGIFCPDSCKCKMCGAVVCRTHAVRKGGACVCVRCGPGGRRLAPRWLPHCLLGLGVSGLTAMAEALLSGSQLMAGAIVIVAAWLPLLGLLLRPLAPVAREDLVYDKPQLQR